MSGQLTDGEVAVVHEEEIGAVECAETATRGIHPSAPNHEFSSLPLLSALRELTEGSIEIDAAGAGHVGGGDSSCRRSG